MTSFHLTEYALLASRAVAWFGSGVLIGALHFLTLHWNVRLFAVSRTPLLAIALLLGRLTLVAVVLGIMAGYVGAFPLLVASGGILAARMAAVRLEGQT